MNRCPFDFQMNCGKACAWYNKEVDKCQLLVTIENLSEAVKESNEIVRGVGGSLRTLIKESKR